MIDDLAYLFAAVFWAPVLAMVGAMAGWAIVEAVLTTIVWPWKDQDLD